MKIRDGYVSNSSSSSFIVKVDELLVARNKKLDKIRKIIEEHENTKRICK